MTQCSKASLQPHRSATCQHLKNDGHRPGPSHPNKWFFRDHLDFESSYRNFIATMPIRKSLWRLYERPWASVADYLMQNCNLYCPLHDDDLGAASTTVQRLEKQKVFRQDQSLPGLIMNTRDAGESMLEDSAPGPQMQPGGGDTNTLFSF